MRPILAYVAAIGIAVTLILVGHNAQRKRTLAAPPMVAAATAGATVGAAAATIAAPKKLTCFVVGDSIAEMVVPFLPCPHSTKVGEGTKRIVGRVEPADIIVVSAGSNDVDNGQWGRLDANLTALASKLGAAKAIWILPSNLAAVHKVQDHMRPGDRAVMFLAGGPKGQAHVHPGCPKCLASDILTQMKALGWN